MNRIDRLAAILIQLQSRPLVKAQDIADKFSISLRTVYRDVKALEQAGVPVIGEAGTGYRLMEGYKLPPVMFSEDEAMALLTASKLVESKTDAAIRRHYTTALDKIRAILRHPQKEQIADIDDHIAVMDNPAFRYTPRTELWLQPILRAIAAKERIEIEYTSLEKNETTLRQLEPVGIYYLGSHWHFVAWCRMRNDYRNFRTDRISRLRTAGEKMTGQHPPLRSFLDKMSCDEKDLTTVVIDVQPDILKYFGEQKYYQGYVQEQPMGSRVRMTFLSSSLTGFARWYMMFGDQARIIEPMALGEIVVGLATSVLEKTGSVRQEA